MRNVLLNQTVRVYCRDHFINLLKIQLRWKEKRKSSWKNLELSDCVSKL